MNTSWAVNLAIGTVLLPPLNLILLCALGICMRSRWPRFGLALSALALILLAVISTRVGASWFIAPLENLNPPLVSARAVQVQAIVVLGAGRISNAPEYGAQDIPGPMALQRLRYAASLQRETGLPLLVTGGRPDGSSESEAVIMARVLQHDFSVPVQWREERSNNTAENAQFASRILRAAGIRRILLVTDAMHMQRAKLAFQQTGLEVVPAPTIFTSSARMTLADFLPMGLRDASYAMHEWLGLAWYSVRHRNLAD